MTAAIERFVDPREQYDNLRAGSAMLGGAVTAVLLYGFEFEPVLSLSLGVNVWLFFWAYTLWEGWHLDE